MPKQLISNQISKDQKIMDVKRNRKSIRLKNYDYGSTGMYFVTVCVQDRECLLGEVLDQEMQLDKYGNIVEQWWQNIPVHFPCTKLGEHIIMPNHVHGIIEITDVGARSPRPMGSPHPITLGQIIAYFKYGSTRQLNVIRNTPVARLWQRNYHDHIIRDDMDLHRIREYIINNSKTWEMDEHYYE